MLKKKPFSLVEVMIAFALTSALLSMLLNIYSLCQKMHKNAVHEREISYEKQFLHAKLAKVLPATRFLNNCTNHYFFYTQEDLLHPNSYSLTFCFDNDAQFNKQFSSDVIGRLYIDKENNLSLATFICHQDWEKTDFPEALKEVLLRNVLSLTFSFYEPPQKKGQEIEEKGQLLETWEASYKKIPAIIYVKILPEGGKEEIFSYPLASYREPITYTVPEEE
jgi:hypothetical protein